MTDTAMLVKERTSRVRAAIALKEHDRVPILGNLGFWPVKYHGKHTMQEACYDIDVLGESYEFALKRWNQWDVMSAAVSSRAPVLDAMGSTRLIIPGRAISPYSDYQHPDQSVMEASEYDQFISDPQRFRAEVILPRVCKRINKDNLYETIKAIAKVYAYSQQTQRKSSKLWNDWAEKYAVVPLMRNVFAVPVDIIADSLRGFNQGLLDVKLRPQKLIEASEALMESSINGAVAGLAPGQDFPVLYNPQHISPYISPKDYEMVYWPFYKRMVDAFTDRGHTVWTVFEGAQDQHLERLQDLPHGKCVAQFESINMENAKKYLGGKICIAGGMPNSILAKGSVNDVEEQVANVLKLFENEPGFIMSTNGGINSAKPENLDAWLKAMKKYGNIGGKLEIVELNESGNDQNQKSIIDRKKLITRWDSVRDDFGEIKGDENLIAHYWEELELSALGFLNMIIRS